MQANEIKEKDKVMLITDTKKFENIIAIWAARQFLREQKVSILDIDDFVSGDFPKLQDQKVLIIGCDFERQSLSQFRHLCQGVCYLDNRWETRGKMEGVKYAYVRVGATLARVVWEYMGGGKATWLVDYTEDLRRWRWAKTNPLFLREALKKYKKDKETLDILSRRDVTSLEDEGRITLKTNKEETENESVEPKTTRREESRSKRPKSSKA